MGRNKKKTLKKYLFDDYYVNIDVYKKKVICFNIRFNYVQESIKVINVTKMKGDLENLFNKEFQYLERSRHLLEVDMVDEMTTKTGRCSLNGYFLRFDDYEDFILRHAQELMKNTKTLFNKNNFEIKMPERTNNYTKIY